MRRVARIGSTLLLVVGCGSTHIEARSDPPAALPPAQPALPCPEDMVLVAGRFCIDRYEASMVDGRSGQTFSPFYPPALEEMRKAVNGQPWGLAALGRAELRPPVPRL